MTGQKQQGGRGGEDGVTGQKQQGLREGWGGRGDWTGAASLREAWGGRCDWTGAAGIEGRVGRTGWLGRGSRD